MFFRKRNAVILLVLFSFLLFSFTLPGCKEGTQKSPVSAILTGATTKTTSGNDSSIADIIGFVLDTSNTELNNIDVELWQDTQLLKSTVTTGEGKFFFYDIDPGTYRIEVAKSSTIYYSKNLNVSILEDGTISPVSPTINLTIRPIESYTIQGFVKTQTSEILSNLEVELRKDSSSSSVIAKTYTTGEGKFFFQNLTSGMYYIKVKAGSTTNASDYYPVQILSDGTMSPETSTILVAQDINIVSYDLKGYIYDAFSGGPIEYAAISVAEQNNVTDKEGIFSFLNLNSGIYNIKIAKSGFDTLETSFVLNNDGTTSPATLSFALVHTMQSGFGSIAGRLIDEATNIGYPNLIVRLYEYRKVTKKTSSGTETDWEIMPNLFLTTRTLPSDPTSVQDQLGTFKLTQLGPTTDTFRYAIYFGLGNSYPTFISVPRSNSNTVWTTFSTTDPSYVYGVSNIIVEANKTTFYTNYEHEK